MKDKEILEKAIEKTGMNFKVIDRIHYPTIETTIGVNSRPIEVNYEMIIFSHDFAEAFFPKEIAKMTWYEELKPYSFEDVESWKVHLMKMVLEENPIDYLRKFIKDEKTNETH